MTQAVIFNLKRMAVHDGPGIRTTLFFKGCPLRCRWCHNPEGISHHPQLGILHHKCVKCGRCQTVCDCHNIMPEAHTIARDRCTVCGRCVSRCLADALIPYGRTVTVSEILPELLEDQLFYETSGGGVTLSGGEPLLQADFCSELLSVLKQEGIHCAVDTCGAVPWGAFEKVLPFTDLFLFDFKHPDTEVHRALTGMGNELIRENLQQLGKLGCPVEIRIPLIPGMNTDDDVLSRSAEFLAVIPSVTVVRLLEYHDLSRAKYKAVDRECTMPENLCMTPDQMRHCAEIYKSYNLKVLLPDD